MHQCSCLKLPEPHLIFEISLYNQDDVQLVNKLYDKIDLKQYVFLDTICSSDGMQIKKESINHALFKSFSEEKQKIIQEKLLLTIE